MIFVLSGNVRMFRMLFEKWPFLTKRHKKGRFAYTLIPFCSHRGGIKSLCRAGNDCLILLGNDKKVKKNILFFLLLINNE